MSSLSSPAGDTPAAEPESRIKHLQDLILAGEDGYTCGAVIPKDILDPSKLVLYFSDDLVEGQYVHLTYLSSLVAGTAMCRSIRKQDLM